jgi:hypothetical protein
VKSIAKRKWNKFYVKWIVRNRILFYGYLLAGIAIVIIVMCSVNIDVMETLPCKYENKKLIIEDLKNISLRENQIVYFYVNQNEKVYAVPVKEYECIGDMTYISFSADDLNKATKGFLEVSKEKENLLLAILR